MAALAASSGFFDYSCQDVNNPNPNAGLAATPKGVSNPCTLNVYSFSGVENFILLPIGITAAQLFHQGFWQRVWASRTDSELRWSCYISGSLFIPIFMIQGW